MYGTVFSPRASSLLADSVIGASCFRSVNPPAIGELTVDSTGEIVGPRMLLIYSERQELLSCTGLQLAMCF